MALLNTPPKEFTRVMPDILRSYTATLFKRAGMPDEDARLLADLLVASDLRGVHSHGTTAVAYYLPQFREKELNVRPQVKVVRETETTAVLDGDGGLGYFPSHRAAHMMVEKAKRYGMGMATTGNHGHFGAAGHYSRIASAAGCIGISISASRFVPSPEGCVWGACGCPPISIAIPSGAEPSLVPDMGLYFNLSGQSFEELFAMMPEAFFKILGLGAVCNVLAAMLAGIHDEKLKGSPYHAAANQGAFIGAIDVARFLPMDEFKRHVDVYVAAARRMKPFPGFDRAELPGTLEWQRERDYARDGIPVSPAHLATLNAEAKEMGVDPFEAFVRSEVPR